MTPATFDANLFRDGSQILLYKDGRTGKVLSATCGGFRICLSTLVPDGEVAFA